MATDICTGWTEAVPLLAREQSLVVEGLEAIAGQLPFPVLGIDSDNDSVFINQTLIGYCADRGIEFTRSRAYRKNDQAWIEQKNGSVVRRFAGYDRYSGRIEGQAMVHLYKSVRLHVNYFQPSFKLLEKVRDGARVIKGYSPPVTPCDRLTEHDETSAVVKNGLREYRVGLDPVALLRSIREAQSAMAAMSSHQPQGVPLGESIERFLTSLPNLWQQGKPGPPTGTRCARFATGVPGRTPSKAFGPTCCCGFKMTPTTTPRTCWQNCARPIRAGSEMPNCGRCSAE